MCGGCVCSVQVSPVAAHILLLSKEWRIYVYYRVSDFFYGGRFFGGVLIFFLQNSWDTKNFFNIFLISVKKSRFKVPTHKVHTWHEFMHAGNKILSTLFWMSTQRSCINFPLVFEIAFDYSRYLRARRPTIFIACCTHVRRHSYKYIWIERDSDGRCANFPGGMRWQVCVWGVLFISAYSY